MATYGVTLPVTGSVYVEVEADSREEAIEKALEYEFKAEHLEEWEVHRQTNRGNVAYGNCTEASADLMDD